MFSCSSHPPVCHPSAIPQSGTFSLSSQEPCCCWGSELCNPREFCAGCRGSACWMSEFWMTNSYKTLASFLVNSTPEQQVAGRMAFKPPACLVPRCSQPLKSLAASFPAQLLLLCLPRFPLEFPQLPLSLLSGLWWSCAALLNYCHTELRGQQHPCNSQRGMGKESLQQGMGQGSCTVPQHHGL